MEVLGSRHHRVVVDLLDCHTFSQRSKSGLKVEVDVGIRGVGIDIPSFYRGPRDRWSEGSSRSSLFVLGYLLVWWTHHCLCDTPVVLSVLLTYRTVDVREGTSTVLGLH